jgi:serine/threonine protein phosphatase PrpC
MRTIDMIAAAGETNAGLQREVNEDRCYVDEARGLFIVIDGVGGQAAGGKAADVALCMLRERLERETGPVAERVREAIAVANNEIHRLAASRPEWDGMACVLTVAVVKDGTATIGHVGDTRLYKLRDGRIEKITRDHSPVGEREDAGEISELDAMRHPRRNEVYRDVGSEVHAPDDPEFVELHEISFHADEALLLCSDGLSDLVDSKAILRAVSEGAGNPRTVIRTLIDAANEAGGKDNVTVVYVEGERFAASQSAASPRQSESAAILLTNTSPMRRRIVLGTIILVLLAITGFVVYRAGVVPSLDALTDVFSLSPMTQTVRADQSIGAAVIRARPGSEIVVEPGEYRERVTLTNNVRLVSRVARGATIRLPATASDTQPEPAVIAAGSGGALIGFRIVGDAQTPLGVGVLVSGSGLSLVDLEISGATSAAVSFAHNGSADLVGVDIHDNPGQALAMLAGATPRVTHSVFGRNGTSQNTPAAFTVEKGAVPLFQRNVFLGVTADVFSMLDEPTRTRLEHENWFVAHGSRRP